MKQQHAHLVGIKGVAMTALALYLKESGVKVTGSDISERFPTDEELEHAHITIYSGFSASRIRGVNRPDVVYYTGAHNGRDNEEVKAALALGIPTFPHGQALGLISKKKRQIVVSGSHGKTTTSAMIAAILVSAGEDPSYAIGCGSITTLGPAGHYGKGSWFVAEGDEYVTDPSHDPTPRFLWLNPDICVVTNIDFDHPDAYPNLTAVRQAFVQLKKRSKTVIYNADDENSNVMKGSSAVSFGSSRFADYQITHIGIGKERMFFTLNERGTAVGEFSLRVPGRHNVSNAAASVIAARASGLDWQKIREGLMTFKGTKRRFEKLAVKNDVTYYDDYAHHPAEIIATIQAARDWYPRRRIIVVFQPHTYSRTKALIGQFSTSFTHADVVILTQIYASLREHDTLGLDDTALFVETKKHHGNVLFAKNKIAVKKELDRTIRSGDIVIFMGAGDIYNWGREII